MENEGLGPATPGTAARCEEQKNEAYSERNQCVALIAEMARRLGWWAGVAQHQDRPGEVWESDWRTIVFIDLPTGQVSWHFHDSEKHLLTGLPEYPLPWDGHDTPEKYRRVRAALGAAGLNGEPKVSAPTAPPEVVPEIERLKAENASLLESLRAAETPPYTCALCKQKVWHLYGGMSRPSGCASCFYDAPIAAAEQRAEAAEKGNTELQGALRAARAMLDRDRTGLAAGLNKVKVILAGYNWLADGEWGSYHHEQRTEATLRQEVGWCLGAAREAADGALHASGKLADEACRAIDAALHDEERSAALAAPKEEACTSNAGATPDTSSTRDAVSSGSPSPGLSASTSDDEERSAPLEGEK